MAQLAVQPRHQPTTKSDINHNNDIEMWLPNRIFKAFRRQCLQEIAWIESFLNDHALLPPEEITEEAMSVLNIASTKLSHVRQRMATEWHRHLKEVAEGGLKHGQKEPSEELKQIIKNTDQQVDQCLRLSEYFRETSTVSVKAITTAPRQNTPIHSGGEADETKRNTPMAVFTALTFIHSSVSAVKTAIGVFLFVSSALSPEWIGVSCRCAVVMALIEAVFGFSEWK